MTLAKARIVNYDCNSSFIVLATFIMIINYDRKTFIVQATAYFTEENILQHLFNLFLYLG